MLIAHGHSLSAIHGYTLAQVRAFLAAIERMNGARRVGEAIAARMAQAEGKAFKEYVKALQRGSDGV